MKRTILGKIEKFILLYSKDHTLYALGNYRDERTIMNNNMDRTHLIYSYYIVMNDLDLPAYMTNIKSIIPKDSYDRLQPTFTRALKSLESKGFLEFTESYKYRADTRRGRKVSFVLTDAGKKRANQLARDSKKSVTNDDSSVSRGYLKKLMRPT